MDSIRVSSTTHDLFQLDRRNPENFHNFSWTAEIVLLQSMQKYLHFNYLYYYRHPRSNEELRSFYNKIDFSCRNSKRSTYSKNRTFNYLESNVRVLISVIIYYTKKDFGNPAYFLCNRTFIERNCSGRHKSRVPLDVQVPINAKIVNWSSRSALLICFAFSPNVMKKNISTGCPKSQSVMRLSGNVPFKKKTEDVKVIWIKKFDSWRFNL